MNDKEKLSWETQMELNKTTGIMLGLLQNRLDSLEKKLEEYSDYMVKVRRIQQDNTKQIAELRAMEKVSLDTIEVISKDYKDIINKLKNK